MAIDIKERKKARGFLKSALTLIPNFLKLLYRLFIDTRAPLAEKALLAGTIIYVVSPLDFLPDVIPFIGQVDDIYLVALVVLRLLSRTNIEVLREHWDGGGDLGALVSGIERASRYVLPERVRRILLGRVEIAPQIKGGLIASPPAPDDLEVERRIRKKTDEFFWLCLWNLCGFIEIIRLRSTTSDKRITK
jgi:uncharacterized membrane protein YkvA (DUF1232 family)